MPPDLEGPIKCRCVGEHFTLLLGNKLTLTSSGQHRNEWEIEQADLVGAALLPHNGEGNPGGFTVWSCPLKASSQAHKVGRRNLVVSLPLYPLHEDASEVVEAIRRIAIPSFRHNAVPRTFSIIVNPVSGRKRGRNVYQEVIAPILEVSAGCRIVLLETTGPKHAEELCRNMKLDEIDGILVVGGDGTLHECMQGLLARKDRKSALQIPIGIVPSGSGNGLAGSLGCMNATASVYCAVKGNTEPVDLFSAIQWLPGDAQGTRCFGFLSFSFGLISDIDIGTEACRCIGSMRFTLGAVQNIMWGKRYKGRLRFLPKNYPLVGSVQVAPTGVDSVWDYPDCPALCEAGLLGATETVVMERGAENSGALGPGWITVEDKFMFVLATNCPKIDLEHTLAPGQAVGSAGIDLMFVTKATVGQSLDFMLKSESGAQMDTNEPLKPAKGCEYLTYHRVQAFIFEPESSGSWICIDGEVKHYGPTAVEVHPGLATFFSSKGAPKIAEP